jgi:hypothetical protein
LKIPSNCKIITSPSDFLVILDQLSR